MSYVELQVTSNFSFLHGGSHPDELVFRARDLGYRAIAITDRNTLAGIVRAHVAAKQAQIQFIPACRLDLLDGPSLLAYPKDRKAYARLSALLSLGNLRAEKGECHLYLRDVAAHQEGIIFIMVSPDHITEYVELDENFVQAARKCRTMLSGGLYLTAVRNYEQDDYKRLALLAELAAELGTPLVATNDVLYHIAERRQLQDVLTCVNEKCDIYNAGFLLKKNAEQHLKPVEEMRRLFMRYPDALIRAEQIASACDFSLDELRYEYPEEICSPGRTPQQELEYLAWKGAKDFYGEPLPPVIIKNIKHELRFTAEMNYAPYFLTVYDIVKYARANGILCQGRGSAANSTVCFCLGITSVDPTKFDLLFERFISSARNEPPDIDVDFEHERREEVIQYIYNKYGRDRAAIVATVTQQRSKGAIRDTGKAMGLSLDAVDRLSASLWEFTQEQVDAQRLREAGLDPADAHLQKTVKISNTMEGFPRQLGQHTGGFVITRGKLTDLCPILNARMADRTNIEWNKDDIDALGFLKIDILALGMLTCIRKAFTLARDHYGLDLTLANIPQDDPEVYKMISAADTLGVFQIESRAQMTMLPRMRPKCFYDLVIEVALVRPGPIQGDMVHPYLRRRNGEEAVDYPSEELKEILGRTLGVPLFQEQAMKIAIVAAGFSPAEADALRRAMATFKLKGLVSQFHDKLIGGMIARGYKPEFAERVFKQLEGFGSYGFPESHAASFALLVYVSCWLKHYYPDVFAAALLNSQPMGFYQPAQIVIDARKHGVEVRPVDINRSRWDHTLEEQSGRYRVLRLGFRQIKGIREDDMSLLCAARNAGYRRISELYDAGVPVAALEKLADADAFQSLGIDRRRALWEVSALADTPQGLFKGQPSPSKNEAQIELPFISEAEQVLRDYSAVSLSLKGHPVQHVRDRLHTLGIISTQAVTQTDAGLIVRTAGLVLVRQRPATAGGVCFVTIEDETGVSNLVVFENMIAKYRREVFQSRLLMVEGKVQREGLVVHVIVQKCYDLSTLLTASVNEQAGDGNALKGKSKACQVRENIDPHLFHKGRNFK